MLFNTDHHAVAARKIGTDRLGERELALRYPARAIGLCLRLDWEFVRKAAMNDLTTFLAGPFVPFILDHGDRRNNRLDL